MQKKLNAYIDHTLLKPEATIEEIRKLCEEALLYQFAAVCILPIWVKKAKEMLKGSSVKLCSVAGFPLGGNLSETKSAEAGLLVKQGVEEVDMVISLGTLKAKDYAAVKQDIEWVVKVASPAIVKVILETCLLTDEEKVIACQIALDAGAHFVKTSTGFSKSGATIQDVTLMRQTVGNQMGVKASGGIRDQTTALAMIKAGASRLGTSASVAIVLAEQSLSEKY